MTLYNSKLPQRPLRANGNLTYLQFIALVEKIWLEAHPNIPILAAGLPIDGQYPCIVYSLANRVPLRNEPKPRQREVLQRTEDDKTVSIIVSAMRFMNYIKFTVVDKIRDNGAAMAEEIIEAFEDFMMNYFGVFKEAGASDLFYERRIPDDEEPRAGEGVVERAVVFRVTLERITHTTVENLEKIWASITIGSVADKDCDLEDSQSSSSSDDVQARLLETVD